MYIFLSSSDCRDSHPENNAWDFTIDLNCLQFDANWECSLTDVYYDGNFGELYICSDLCTTSYVNDAYLRILRVVNSPTVFIKPYFIPLSRTCIDHVRVYIRTRNGHMPSVVPDHLTCTLQFRRQNVNH